MAELIDRMKYEEAAVKRFGYLSQQHRREFRDLLGSPPDIANVPQEFWEKVQKEHEAEALAMLALLLAASAAQHGLDEETATRQARDWAAERAKQQAGGWVENSQEILRRRQQEWGSRPIGTDGASLGGGSLVPDDDEVDDVLDLLFGEDRIERLVATETTVAQHAGSELAVAFTVGLSRDDKWITERDSKVCKVCNSLSNTTRDTWSALMPDGPPAHPNCRCWIDYAEYSRREEEVTA